MSTQGIAEKGKSTMGWFFGFKLHLIINDKGELLTAMTKEVIGKLFGDKGYISQALY